MIELSNNALRFQFPEVHAKARCTIDFQRTLRIPDDNRDYPLPPGLGRFPVEHVDDYAQNLPVQWVQHGGVLLPMYQAEALWINFDSHYPCAVKIAAGKINAVSGKSWSNELRRSPQDYIVSSEQPWLDGFNVAEGLIRQFVAMPLGDGYTAEEQITGGSEHGGLQVIVYPMKAEVYTKYFERQTKGDIFLEDVQFCMDVSAGMGLAPGGLMRQEIYEDEYGIDAWDTEHSSRCFVHLLNSLQFQAITGRQPPHEPPTAREYTKAGLPWFEYYSDAKAVAGSDVLAKMKGIAAKMAEKEGKPLKGNDPLAPGNIKQISTKDVVRESEF